MVPRQESTESNRGHNHKVNTACKGTKGVTVGFEFIVVSGKHNSAMRAGRDSQTRLTKSYCKSKIVWLGLV